MTYFFPGTCIVGNRIMVSQLSASTFWTINWMKLLGVFNSLCRGFIGISILLVICRPQWQSVLTGANYNRELKLWRCDRWECMYHLTFEPSHSQDLLPTLQIRIDATANFAILSDIKRSVSSTCNSRKFNIQLICFSVSLNF